MERVKENNSYSIRVTITVIPDIYFIHLSSHLFFGEC